MATLTGVLADFERLVGDKAAVVTAAQAELAAVTAARDKAMADVAAAQAHAAVWDKVELLAQGAEAGTVTAVADVVSHLKSAVAEARALINL